MQLYLETVIAREDGVKEVKLLQLGPRLMQRYRDIFAKLFVEDRKLTLRRDTWGFLLGLLIDRRALRSLWLDSHYDHCRRHYAGRHDNVPRTVSSGAVGRCRNPHVSKRHVRR